MQFVTGSLHDFFDKFKLAGLLDESAEQFNFLTHGQRTLFVTPLRQATASCGYFQIDGLALDKWLLIRSRSYSTYTELAGQLLTGHLVTLGDALQKRGKCSWFEWAV